MIYIIFYLQIYYTHLLQYNKKLRIAMINKLLDQQLQKQSHQENKEMSAIDRLRSLDEKKTINEQLWQQKQPFQKKVTEFRKRHQIHTKNASSLLQQKKKEMVQVLRGRQQILQETSFKVKRQSPELEASNLKFSQLMEEDSNIKLLKNTRLRPFNSNITFYNIKKEGKQMQKNPNLTFYRHNNERNLSLASKSQENFTKKPNPEDFEQIKINKKNRYENSTVYFKSNKSQTIRQLLNRIKEEKQKNNSILLSSSIDKQQTEDQRLIRNQYINDFEVKQMEKYKKFIPFQKNQNLLIMKISQSENSWVKKYRQSFYRNKNRVLNQRKLLKPLKVKE